MKKKIDAEDLKNDLCEFLDKIRDNDEIAFETKSVQCAMVRAFIHMIEHRQKGGKKKC